MPEELQVHCGICEIGLLSTLSQYPLHSPNGRHLPAIRAVHRDCDRGLKNGGNSQWSSEPILQWGTRQSQSIIRPTNYKTVMPANWRSPLLPHWQSYCHQARTVYQSWSIVTVACWATDFQEIGSDSGWDMLSGAVPFFPLWPGLTHLPVDKVAAISQTIFSDAFSWMKSFVFWLNFHWNLFLRVQFTITRHWFRNFR